MFIELNEDLIINLYQVASIEIAGNDKFSPENLKVKPKKNEEFLIVFYMTSNRFIIKDTQTIDVINEENPERYFLTNDIYVLERFFKTREEARVYLESKLGMFFVNNKMGVKLN